MEVFVEGNRYTCLHNNSRLVSKSISIPRQNIEATTLELVYENDKILSLDNLKDCGDQGMRTEYSKILQKFYKIL